MQSFLNCTTNSTTWSQRLLLFSFRRKNRSWTWPVDIESIKDQLAKDSPDKTIRGPFVVRYRPCS